MEYTRAMRSAVIATLLLVACAPSAETSTETSVREPIAARTTPPVIATLATHDRKVSILGRGSDGELRVTVRDTGGAVLADGITVDELYRRDPLLGAIVNSATAQSHGTYLDATLDRPPPPLR